MRLARKMPRVYNCSMNWNDVLTFLTDPYNIAYLLTLLAYIIHDVLWLRVILLGAHTGFLILALIHAHTTGLIWNPLFIAINAYHIAKLAWARRSIRFSPEIEAHYQNAFSLLSRSDMLRFWNMGTEITWEGQTVLEEGKSPGKLIFILEGQLLIKKDGTTLAELAPGRFAAEMAYLTGSPASADVHAKAKVRAQVWDYAILDRIQHKDLDLFSRLQGVLGKELARKVIDRNPGRSQKAT